MSAGGVRVNKGEVWMAIQCKHRERKASWLPFEPAPLNIGEVQMAIQCKHRERKASWLPFEPAPLNIVE